MSRQPRLSAAGRLLLHAATRSLPRVLPAGVIGERWRSPQPRDTARRRSRRRGQALVELAIVLPVLLVVVGAAIDLGRLFQANVAIENAAREGAFFGARNPRCDIARTGCTDPATVDWHVRNELPGLTITAPVVTCLDGASGMPKSVTACVENDRYQVTVGHQFNLLTPLLAPILGNQLLVSSTSTAVVLNEAFDPNATPFPMPSPTGGGSPPPPPPGGCTTAPAANFSTGQQNKSKPVDFTDTSTFLAGCPITSWTWVFGDGSPNSVLQDPSHGFPGQGSTYDVTLTVVNGSGLSNSITKAVTTK